MWNARASLLSGACFSAGRRGSPRHLTESQRDLLATSKPLDGYRLSDHSKDAVLNVLLFLRLDSGTRQHDVEHVRVYYHTREGSFVHQSNVHYVAFPGDQCPSRRRRGAQRSGHPTWCNGLGQWVPHSALTGQLGALSAR